MKVLEYVYAAKIDRSDLDLFEFMEILNMLRMMLLKEAAHVVYHKIILDLERNVFPMKDVIASIKLSVDLKLALEQDFLDHIYGNPKYMANISVEERKELFAEVGKMSQRDFNILMLCNDQNDELSLSDETIRFANI